MKKVYWLAGCLIFSIVIQAQIGSRLESAIRQLENDPQMRHAVLGFCVVDRKTGKPVYLHKAQIGLAPASTQKLFTSCATLDLLGQAYKFKTEIGYDGAIKDSVLTGDLYIMGYGDPTLGSWRWKETNADSLTNQIIAAIKKMRIKEVTGEIQYQNDKFSRQAIPDGWVWQDIGNYYGAGAYDLNWKENQYNLHLQSGRKIGDKAGFNGYSDADYFGFFTDELVSAEKGSGDNANIYLATENSHPLLKGTIPVFEKDFIIAGAHPNPPHELAEILKSRLAEKDILFSKKNEWHAFPPVSEMEVTKLKAPHSILTLFSPPLDSINYWFLRKSINLYGEAFLKTIAYEKTGFGSIEKGVVLLKDYWSQRGIEKSALNIMDGSGLSPQNRVTTDALTKVLQYAISRPWYDSFLNSLPELNGMKMKSGSIGGVKAYAGYQKAKDGNEYIFSIVVNNYDGSAAEIISKLFKVLDLLK